MPYFTNNNLPTIIEEIDLHHGPGVHKGTGSPQSVHGGAGARRAIGAAAKDIPSPGVKGAIARGARKVVARMVGIKQSAYGVTPGKFKASTGGKSASATYTSVHPDTGASKKWKVTLTPASGGDWRVKIGGIKQPFEIGDDFLDIADEIIADVIWDNV